MLKRFNTVNESDHRDQVYDYYDLGKGFAERKEWSNAVAYFEHAINLLEMIPEYKWTVDDYQNFALYYNQASNACFEENDLSMALSYTQKATALLETIALQKHISRETLTKNNIVLALYYNNAGNIYLAMDKQDDALAGYHAAIAIMEKISNEDFFSDDDRRQLGLYYNNAGNIYFIRDDVQAASEYFQKAIFQQNAIVEKIIGEDDAALINYLNNNKEATSRVLDELRTQNIAFKKAAEEKAKQASSSNDINSRTLLDQFGVFPPPPLPDNKRLSQELDADELGDWVVVEAESKHKMA